MTPTSPPEGNPEPPAEVSPTPLRSAPFDAGSVSIRLYPHNELSADGIIRELCAQAGLALEGGFDGVMTSEHHGGFAGYMAQPLQMTSFILEECATGWAAAAPLLLPLRSAALVAEEVAWLQARHPGRVGLGVAAGALPLDFETAGVSQSEAVDRFKVELPRLVAMLRGEELGDLDGDPALLACRTAPVPVLSAAVSVAAAVRAAQCGGGILMEGMSPPERLVGLTPRLRRGRWDGLQSPDPSGMAGSGAVRADRQPTGRLRELRRTRVVVR